MKRQAWNEFQFCLLSPIPTFSLTYKDTLCESLGELNFALFQDLPAPGCGKIAYIEANPKTFLSITKENEGIDETNYRLFGRWPNVGGL